MKKTGEQKGKGAFVRMCASCGKKQQQSDMFRLLRTPDLQVIISTDRKASGRSAYLCKDRECVLKAKKSRRPERSLDCQPLDEIYDQLLKMLEEVNDDR